VKTKKFEDWKNSHKDYYSEYIKNYRKKNRLFVQMADQLYNILKRESRWGEFCDTREQYLQLLKEIKNEKAKNQKTKNNQTCGNQSGEFKHT
jgi:hypothetical protein